MLLIDLNLLINLNAKRLLPLTTAIKSAGFTKHTQVIIRNLQVAQYFDYFVGLPFVARLGVHFMGIVVACLKQAKVYLKAHRVTVGTMKIEEGQKGQCSTGVCLITISEKSCVVLHSGSHI